MARTEFSDEEIERLNNHQNDQRFHPYTCDRHSEKCTVKENDGTLIATKEGWICPCGDYKQNWYH